MTPLRSNRQHRSQLRAEPEPGLALHYKDDWVLPGMANLSLALKGIFVAGGR
jgi:hypothetical protein